METIEIRPMDHSDYEAVLSLWRASEGVGLSAADSYESICRYLTRNPGLSQVALSCAGEMVGAVLCGHDGRRGLLHHLAVRPDYRRRGLGRRLVDRCMAALHAEAIDKCHLFVFHENHAGRSFWRKLDWYERPELVLMSKDIQLMNDDRRCPDGEMPASESDGNGAKS